MLRHQLFARQLRQVGQPFRAPRQHAGDQILEPQPAVVEAAQDAARSRLLKSGIGFGMPHRLARGERVQIVGRIGDAARRSRCCEVIGSEFAR